MITSHKEVRDGSANKVCTLVKFEFGENWAIVLET